MTKPRSPRWRCPRCCRLRPAQAKRWMVIENVPAGYCDVCWKLARCLKDGGCK